MNQRYLIYLFATNNTGLMILSFIGKLAMILGQIVHGLHQICVINSKPARPSNILMHYFLSVFWSSCNLGGHYHWKVVRGCALVMTPFFHASQCSLAYQFTINVPLMCPPFSIFGKKCNFSLVLAKISALETQNFWIFAPKTPHFFKKTGSLDPTFGNRHGTYPSKKFECPTGL